MSKVILMSGLKFLIYFRINNHGNDLRLKLYYLVVNSVQYQMTLSRTVPLSNLIRPKHTTNWFSCVTHCSPDIPNIHIHSCSCLAWHGAHKHIYRHLILHISSAFNDTLESLIHLEDYEKWNAHCVAHIHTTLPHMPVIPV